MKKYWIVLFRTIMGIVALVVVKALLSDLDTTGWTPAVKVFANDLIPIVLTCSIIVGAISGFCYSGVVYYQYQKWGAFGNRMKAAYSVKFGGKNPEFNKEVDQHIRAMQTLGKGSTKSINEAWLKRMAKFVEIPYIIPEEERISEVEKTEQFENKKVTVI